jgi:nucleoside-diphosphate-sugar epimerase
MAENVLAELLDVFRLIEGITGQPLRIEQIDSQHGDMRDTYADTSRARVELGFSPAVALDAGLRAQYDWIVAEHE